MNALIFASDRVALSSRAMTEEGYLVAPGIIARAGVQPYHAFELGLTDGAGGGPMRVLRLYRPASEVFDAESLASFEGCPITIDHPQGEVTRENWAQLAKGDVRNVTRDGNHMAAMLTIKSRDAIEALEGGKRELSNGYTFTLDMTSGTTASGERYDGVQRNIRGNHVALVDSARCGSACRVSDSSTLHPKGNKTMTEAIRRVVVDGIPVEVSETAAAAIDKLTQARDQALTALKAAPTQTALDALANEAKALREAVAAKDKEIEALKKDVVTPAARDAMVGQWARLLDDAKRLMPSLATEGKSCHAIRKEVLGAVQDAGMRAVLKAVIGEKNPAELDEATASTAFGAIAAMAPAAQAGDGTLSAALLGAGGSTRAKAVDARSLWAANLNNVHQE